jgi:hypothetical protein
MIMPATNQLSGCTIFLSGFQLPWSIWPKVQQVKQIHREPTHEQGGESEEEKEMEKMTSGGCKEQQQHM